MYSIIGTWKMSLAGMQRATELLAAGGFAGDAVETAIMDVEDNPEFMSVGFGGLPDRDGHVFTDCAYMDGNSLKMGAAMSVEHVANPIQLARGLCGRETNCLLAGRGAEEAAVAMGLKIRDMRTEKCMEAWKKETMKKEIKLDAYRGHDTVCVLAMDAQGRMIAGTSTSGLFMKDPGRVGDSPIIGSGFYCDARFGAAAATGLGEDIMRGCLSYEIVSLMRRGVPPLEACREALTFLSARKIALGEDAGSMSVIAMNAKGETGAATTLDIFPYTVGGPDGCRLYTVGKKEDPPHAVTAEEMDQVP